MDKGSGLPEEHRSYRCVCNGSVFEIRDLDLSVDYMAFCVMFYDFWKEAHLEDLNRYCKTPKGSVNEIEGMITKYLDVDRCEVKIGFYQNIPIGFMIYHKVFDCIVAIRACYFVKEYREAGLIKEMLKSTGDVSRVFGQTYTEHPPKQANKQTNKQRIIASYDSFDVWEYVFNEGKING